MIARRYALAFLNVFPLQLETIDSIKQAITFLDQHDEVFLMLKIPLLDDEKKTHALQDYLIEKFALPEVFKQLIAVLISQKRSYLINDILRLLVELYEERANIEFFEVRSSAPLNDADLKAVEQFLADNTNHTILAQQVPDKELIAGIRLQSAQHLWEYSVAKQLRAVEKCLKE